MGKKEQTISKKIASHIKDGTIIVTSANRKNISYQIVLLAYEILVLHFPKEPLEQVQEVISQEPTITITEEDA